MSEDKKFAEGLYFNEAKEGSPEWILGSISIEPKRFVEWLRENHDPKEKYTKIDIKMGKSGKPYTELNSWKPSQGGQVPNNSFKESEGSYGGNASSNSGPESFSSDIPF